MFRLKHSLFPAHAGVILKKLEDAIASMTFPRMRGGDPRLPGQADGSESFSPHARG